MAKRGRRPPDVEVKDGPISEGLRGAIEASGISKYALAKEAGISKPQFYRFLKGERALSQEGLNSLATRLGVRIDVSPGDGSARTDSEDSVESPTVGGDRGESPSRLAVPVRLSKLIGDLEVLIDEEFASIEARIAGLPTAPSDGQAGVWDRMRRLFRPQSRRRDVVFDRPPLGPLAGGQASTTPLIERDPATKSDQITPRGLIDDLRFSIKSKVRTAIEDATAGMRTGEIIEPGVAPPAPPVPPSGPPGKETALRRDGSGGDEWTTQTIV